MNIYESVMSALSGIMGGKTRSVLTMFGIIVGISSVMMIVSIGEGVKASVARQFEEMGMDVMTLRTNGEATIEESDRLTYSDVTELRKYDEIAYATGGRSIYIGDAAELMERNKTRDIYIRGVDADYFYVESVKLASGRYIINQDVTSGSAVIIIDEDFAMQFFGKTDVIGEKLEFDSYWNKLECTVIGIIASDRDTQMTALYNRAARVYVPLSYVNDNFWEDDAIDSIVMKGTDPSDLRRIADNVVRLTEMRHDNKDGNKYAVNIMADMLNEVDTVINMFTLFLGFVAAISLLVGGIGVMNIMLVSVTERTREIGIRKSLGATGGNITLQFLIEAVILTGIGGAVGILLGYGGGIALGRLASMLMEQEITPSLTAGNVLLVVSISAGIGIVFGVYPAGRAAKLDPIEALRFEG